jgi:MarR family 2-MHQ and catechol resistance regulon transcriptional repressor
MTEDRREAFYNERIRRAGPQYPGFDLPSVEIYMSLRHTEDVLNQACCHTLTQHGLSKSSVNILMLLRHGPEEGMQLHDLGDLLLVSRANVTGLIDHLENKGFVTRAMDPHDRRARLARITAIGEEFLDTYMPVHHRNVKMMLKGLSDTEKATLLQLLRKTRESISASYNEWRQPEAIEFSNAD